MYFRSFEYLYILQRCRDLGDLTGFASCSQSPLAMSYLWTASTPKVVKWSIEFGSNNFGAGGPGTGKGTQCERMVKEFGFKHISLGDMLRAEVKAGSQIGEDCAAIMKEGKLVPMKLTMQLLQKAIKQPPTALGYLLDGFPRAVNQAKEFHKLV